MHGKASTKLMSIRKLVRWVILLLKVGSRVPRACPPLLPMLSTMKDAAAGGDEDFFFL